MTYYIKSGDVFTISAQGSIDIRELLPVGTYIVKYNEKQQFYYLEQAGAFGSVPPKLYGSVEKTADRIMRTFLDRDQSTGALLGGEKGSGKTMLARMLSAKAALIGIPTLVINSAFSGDTFNKFIQDINQNCVVVFDEFEKVYANSNKLRDEDANLNGTQEQLLTLLDGTFPQKKLFLLTCNNVHDIDQHMINRPGRIFYLLEYKGLEDDFVREYLTDNLIDKAQVDPFMRICSTVYDNMNFDMMKAIVEEMNRYDETISDVLPFINARASAYGKTTYTATVRAIPEAGKPAVKRVYTTTLTGNPLAKDHHINFEDIEEHDTYTKLTSRNLKSMDMAAGVFVFVEGGYEFRLEREDVVMFDYMKEF